MYDKKLQTILYIRAYNCTLSSTIYNKQLYKILFEFINTRYLPQSCIHNDIIHNNQVRTSTKILRKRLMLIHDVNTSNSCTQFSSLKLHLIVYNIFMANSYTRFCISLQLHTKVYNVWPIVIHKFSITKQMMTFDSLCLNKS